MKFILALAALVLSHASAFAQTVPPITLQLGDTVPLHMSQYKGCDGQVTATPSDNGSVNLVFRGLTQCSKFSIVNANFQDLNYTRPLQGHPGAYGGGFTIPRALVQEGVNIMYIQMHYNSGKHSDLIEVIFAKPCTTNCGGDDNS